MTGDDFLKALACYVALREAKTLPEQIAILFVIRNRTEGKHGFGKGWETTLANMLGWTTSFDVRDPNVIQLLQAVDTIFDGTRSDSLTGNAVYFGPMDSLAIGNLQQTAVVGSTLFYGVKEDYEP